MFVLLIPVCIVIIDQITKTVIVDSMVLGENQVIIDKVLELSYIHNDGAAFSILEGKQTLLICFTVVVMLAIAAYMIVYKKSTTFLERLSLSLILGGGVGNLIDRVLNGYVVDFINIHIIPVFNVADIAITVGCLLFAISVLIPQKK